MRGDTSGSPGHRCGVVLSVAFFAGLLVSNATLGTLAAVLGRLLTQWKVAFAVGTQLEQYIPLIATTTCALLGRAAAMRTSNVAVAARPEAVAADGAAANGINKAAPPSLSESSCLTEP